jgi:TolB protein
VNTVTAIKTYTILLILVCTAGAVEKVRLEAYASGFDTIPIAVLDFRADSASAIQTNSPWEIIVADLGFSGRFRATRCEKIDTALFRQNNIGIFIDGQYRREGSDIVLDCYLNDAASLDVLLGKKYQGSESHLRSMAHRFSNQVFDILLNEAGGFESKILYVEDNERTKNIFIMDYDGFNRKQLTNDATVNVFPAFIDSNTILWTGFARGKPDLYRGNLLSGSYSAIVYSRYLSTSPAVSTLTNRIAYASSKEGNLDVYICDFDGNNRRQITFKPSIDTSPCWSPNGYQIAFTSDRSGQPQIYIMDSDGANQRRLTYQGNYQDSPAWSPKGDKIAYSSMQNGKFDIWIINVDGSNPVQVTHCAGNNENPTWSPTGTHIAFASSNKGVGSIYTVWADGTHLQKITTNGRAKMPDWSHF